MQLEELVAEAVELTGAAPPALFEPDAPVLAEEAIAGAPEQGFYLVGLIGGKDVGKSALVNALVGRDITPRTSHGPGTETVIAYCHHVQADPLRQLLERLVSGRYRIVTHDVDALARQVLLDLPDIDSHYREHVEITRRMLRHMLYPIWVQSVEKYADAQPRELLQRVAAGNSPENFLFCLNKVDQLIAHEGADAVEELRADYAGRLAGVLALAAPPRVWMISALRPDALDLPALRQVLSRHKSAQSVQLDQQLAARQRHRSVLRWAREQDLPHRLERLGRLKQHADELLARRIGMPLLDHAIPHLLDDPAHRLGLLDACLGARMKRWPIVGIVHGLLSPVVALLRRRLSLQQQRGLGGAAALVDNHLAEAAIADRVQSTFAQLQQADPLVSTLYRHRKLWERPVAEQAEADLRRRLAATIERQRALLAETLSRRDNLLFALWRACLTIGALVWFPFVQPVLEALLRDWTNHSLLHIGLLLVRILSVSFLLTNASFLLIWFFVLWALVRWNTQRKIDHQLARWRDAGATDPAANPAGATVEWLDDQTHPIHDARARLAQLLARLDALEANSA